MPAGVPFLPALAQGLMEHYGERLQDALILLPTRRAVRALGDAFVEAELFGAKAALLPEMRPLADIDSDDITYEPGEMLAKLLPPIAPLQRHFELARLIALYHQRKSDLPLSASNAMAMAEPLCTLLDDAIMEGSPLPHQDKLESIRQQAAKHFQDASIFYEILRDFWPERLRELGLMDAKDRQIDLLVALRQEWAERPPTTPVIAAGSTGTLKATAELIRDVSRLPDGMVILPGLDRNLRDIAGWNDVDARHPQSSLKTLLGVMGLERNDVSVWPAANSSDSQPLQARRRIISEALIPVDAATDWPRRIAQLQEEGIDFAEALEGMSLIEARHEEEEALTIALILREALQKEGRTAALITPDSGLARRVRTRLRRWDVEVDYSQGRPLEESSRGAYLLGLMRLALDPQGAVDLAYIMKHPLTALGRAQGGAHAEWLTLEPAFRGTVPPPETFAGSLALQMLSEAMQSLIDSETATADGWARMLSRALELIVSTDTRDGAAIFWADEAGEETARLMEDIIRFGDLLGPITAQDFYDLLKHLMQDRVVRDASGTHPRLSILGPLEARMLSADVLVLGGLNEGVWPGYPTPTPYLSRSMRRELGLSLPERRFGLSAHDFAQSASHPQVMLTRSQRGSDGPTIASRWVWRLKTLTRGALEPSKGEAWSDALKPAQPYLDWARAIDMSETLEPASAPKPTPPKEDRWPKGRKLSMTRIKTWVRDPYSIYCREVLDLRPLDALGLRAEARDWGTMIHEALERFFTEHRDTLPTDATQRLATTFEQTLIEYGFPITDLAKERVRMHRLAGKVIDWARARRDAGWRLVGTEFKGELILAEQNFKLTGKIDHIETTPEGYAAIDFKTGTPPSASEVAAGFDPQLPLTALMLKEGKVFPDGEPDAALAPGTTRDLIYAEVKGYSDNTVTRKINTSKTADELCEAARDNLTKLIALFDDPATAYTSQPRRKYVNSYGDYDHLARRGEWAEAGEESSDGG